IDARAVDVAREALLRVAEKVSDGPREICVGVERRQPRGDGVPSRFRYPAAGKRSAAGGVFDGGGKDAGARRSGRNGADLRRAIHLPRALPRREKERAVVNRRAAGGRPELV